MKILSLPKHENLTTSKKYCGKEEKLLLRCNFSSFPQCFRYISNLFVKCGCSIYFFFNSENLIYRGTDISKCFRESFGIRDNESWLQCTWMRQPCDYSIAVLHFFVCRWFRMLHFLCSSSLLLRSPLENCDSRLWPCVLSSTVDSRYLEVQGTFWNTSRYTYLDISDLQNWGKNKSNNTFHKCKLNLTPVIRNILKILWKRGEIAP